MEETKIDIEKYRELPVTYFKKLSGEKLLTFDVLDQNGDILFKAGHAITAEEVEASLKEGKRFFVPKVEEATGTYDHNILEKQTFQDLARTTAKEYATIRQTGSMSYQQFLDSHKQLVSIAQGLKREDRSGGMLSLLKDIEDFDYYTFVHSTNVGILCMILGFKLGYAKDRINSISIAGYLHDIGKLRVPLEVIEKDSVLNRNEYAAIMEHTRNGYRILDAIENSVGEKAVPNLIKLAALFHHRKFKSRGYPFRGDSEGTSEKFYMSLPDDVRLIGICDIYDAITSSTPYRKGVTPEEGLKYILNVSNYYFTINDVYRFLKPMALSLNKGKTFLKEDDYIILESVKTVLKEHETKQLVYEFARIIKTYRGRPMEPNVEIFYDVTKNKKVRHIEVDLRYDRLRKIVRVLGSERLKEMLLKIYQS